MIGKIYITGQIGTDQIEGTKGVELIDIISQVKSQPNASSFEVFINSEGGLVDVGFDIFNYLRSLGLPITTIGSGIVASIATVIFMAGSQRVLRENTPFMIHLPWGGCTGTAEEIESYSQMLRAVEKKVIDFYKKELGVSEEAVSPLLKNETWLTYEQASSLGFTTAQPIAAAAKVFIKTSNNMNKMTEEDKSFFQDLFAPLAKLFSKKPVAKIVQDANGNELDFADLADDAVIEVGAIATVAGEPAEGDFVMPDGSTYTFEKGELKTITPAADGGEDDAEALRAENEELKRQLEEANAKAANAENKAVEAENKVTTIETEFAKVRAQITSKFDLDGKKEKKTPKTDEPTNRAAAYKK